MAGVPICATLIGHEEKCNPQVKFWAITYPDLIQTLAVQHGTAHGAYVDYLTERYF